MGRFLKYIFTASDTQGVCASQTIVNGTALKLNGTFSDAINSQVVLLDQGYSRTITIVSTNNLSAITFTILGVQNGVTITENLVGGTANTTVESTLIYDKIISITPNGSTTAVRVGTGYKGFIGLIPLNNNAGILPSAISLSNPSSTINTTLYASFDNLPNNGQTFLTMIGAATTYHLQVEKAAGTEALTVLDTPGNIVTAYLVYINGTAATAAQVVSCVFIQTIPK